MSVVEPESSRGTKGDAMCGIPGAYVTGAGASVTAFLTVMIASGIDPRFDLDYGHGRSTTPSS